MKEKDKVKRPIDVYNFKKGYKYGIIIKKYSEPLYPELYSVKWNNGIVNNGYLPHGLELI